MSLKLQAFWTEFDVLIVDRRIRFTVLYLRGGSMSGLCSVLGSMEDQEGLEDLFVFNFISCVSISDVIIVLCSISYTGLPPLPLLIVLNVS